LILGFSLKIYNLSVILVNLVQKYNKLLEIANNAQLKYIKKTVEGAFFFKEQEKTHKKHKLLQKRHGKNRSI